MTNVFGWLTIFFDYMRTTQIVIGGANFSYMDIFFWTILASIVVGAINKLLD